MMWTRDLILTFASALTLAGCTPAEEVATSEAAAPASAVVTAADPAAYRGAAVAGQVCSRCHDVGMGAPPVMEIGAPKFRELAGRPESTAESLAAKMRESHPVMPDYIFDDADISELAAYILSLRGDPG